MKKFLLAVATLVTALITQASAAADLGPQDIQTAIDTYKSNEMRFKRDYIGKSIGFVWTFRSTTEGWFGNGWRVTFGTNGGFSGGNVDCSGITDQATLDKVVEWNKGQKVRVTGTVHDVTMGDLQLKQCKLETVN